MLSGIAWEEGTPACILLFTNLCYSSLIYSDGSCILLKRNPPLIQMKRHCNGYTLDILTLTILQSPSNVFWASTRYFTSLQCGGTVLSISVNMWSSCLRLFRWIHSYLMTIYYDKYILLYQSLC